MTERALTTDELIEKVRTTGAQAQAVVADLQFLVQQLRKQIEAEGTATDDRKHA